MNSPKQSYHTANAPASAGSYSQAVRRGNILAVAGQVALDPAKGSLVEGGITEQTRQVFANLEAVLAEAGASFDDVLMARVYLASDSYFDEMNAVFNTIFREPYPSRTTVAVELGEGMLVEIDLLAVLPE